MRAFLYASLVLATTYVTAGTPSPAGQDGDIADRARVNPMVAVLEPRPYMGQGGSPVALAAASGPIQCYTCVGCDKVTSDTVVKTCPYSNDFSKQNKCIVYTEKYQDMEWTVRGCASDRNTCAEIGNGYDPNFNARKLLRCNECEGDKCNKSSLSHSLSGVTIAFFLFITPLLTKLTLS